VTEGTRTPDLQGHNLGSVAVVGRCSPSIVVSYQGGLGLLARGRLRSPAFNLDGAVARMLPVAKFGCPSQGALGRGGAVRLPRISIAA